MAIGSVNQMVHDRLPFTSPAGNDAIIERWRVQMCYLMQDQTQKSDAAVETEIGYKALENMLFAGMVAYQLINNKIVLTLAGNGVSGGGGAKILTKGKADVVEAEFTVSKAIDGAMLQMDTETFLDRLCLELSGMAQGMGYRVPFCNCMTTDVRPPFIVVENCKPVVRSIYDGNAVP